LLLRLLFESVSPQGRTLAFHKKKDAFSALQADEKRKRLATWLIDDCPFFKEQNLYSCEAHFEVK
jgi:thymidine kinase